MDGENNGKPYEQMDDLGGFPLFLETPIKRYGFDTIDGNQKSGVAFTSWGNGSWNPHYLRRFLAPSKRWLGMGILKHQQAIAPSLDASDHQVRGFQPKPSLST